MRTEDQWATMRSLGGWMDNDYEERCQNSRTFYEVLPGVSPPFSSLPAVSSSNVTPVKSINRGLFCPYFVCSSQVSYTQSSLFFMSSLSEPPVITSFGQKERANRFSLFGLDKC